MSRFLSYTFPAGNTTDVCLLQTLAGAATLTLNGNLVNLTTGVMSFANQGYSRQISITSGNNLSARTFTVIGTQNGATITEDIAGPNNTTVYSTLIYDVITSITVNGAAAAVSVGSGWQGFFPLIGINLERPSINYTLTLAKLTAANSQTAVFGTIDNIINNGSTYLSNITNNYNIFTIKAMAASDQYAYSNIPTGIYTATALTTVNPTYSSLIIQVGQAAGTIANSMKLNFIQI